jgi:hypothetical protein
MEDFWIKMVNKYIQWMNVMWKILDLNGRIRNYFYNVSLPRATQSPPKNKLKSSLLVLPTKAKGKDVVFRFIIEYIVIASWIFKGP